MNIPEGAINVTGIDPYKLIVELCNNTETVDTPYCREHHKIIDRDVTIEEVKKEITILIEIGRPSGLPYIPDYMFGRSIKCSLVKDTDGEVYLTNTTSYDRDSSPGNAQRVVNQCRKQEQPDVW